VALKTVTVFPVGEGHAAMVPSRVEKINAAVSPVPRRKSLGLPLKAMPAGEPVGWSGMILR
jgi:hypothetical protein